MVRFSKRSLSMLIPLGTNIHLFLLNLHIKSTLLGSILDVLEGSGALLPFWTAILL